MTASCERCLLLCAARIRLCCSIRCVQYQSAAGSRDRTPLFSARRPAGLHVIKRSLWWESTIMDDSSGPMTRRGVYGNPMYGAGSAAAARPAHWTERWFFAWVRAHVMFFMAIYNAVDKLNDYVFGMFLWIVLLRARQREPLVQAVSRGDLRKVRKLLRNGTPKFEPDDKGRTPLHVALENLEEAIIEEEEASEDEDSADEAVAPTSTSMTRQPTDKRVPPLQISQGPSSVEWQQMVQCLLEHATDVNETDSQERAPIHMTVRAGFHALTRSLIDAGADVALPCKGKTTLHQAAANRDTRMVALLLDAARTSSGPAPAAYVNSMGRDGWSALGLASRVGDAAIVRALLDAGCDTEGVMKTGKTALEIAKLNKKTAVVQLLERSSGEA